MREAEALRHQDRYEALRHLYSQQYAHRSYVREAGYLATLRGVCLHAESTKERMEHLPSSIASIASATSLEKLHEAATQCLAKIHALPTLPTSVAFARALVRRVTRAFAHSGPANGGGCATGEGGEGGVTLWGASSSPRDGVLAAQQVCQYCTFVLLCTSKASKVSCSSCCRRELLLLTSPPPTQFTCFTCFTCTSAAAACSVHLRY